MSEDMPGRARGRSRGRSRLKPSTRPGPRQPTLTRYQHPQTLEQQTSKQQELAGRARAHSQVVTDPVRGVTEKLVMAGLTCQQGEGTSTAPLSRGGIRTRRYDDTPSKPESISSKKGTSGKMVTLQSNYFKLQTHTEWALYQYHVDFIPEEDRTIVKKGLLRVHKDLIGPYIFDGAVLFTVNKLHPDPLELYSSRISDETKIKITIKKTTDLVMGDPTYLQFFNIVLRKCIAGLNLQLVGRDYYDAVSKVRIEKYNLELWPGYVTSIRQHENNILLGVDLANKIMRKDTVLNLLHDVSQRSDNWQKLFVEAIVGQIVITHYNNKTYRVDDIDFESTPLSTFEKGKEKISYVDYYQTRYGIKISNRNQPLLISRPKLKDMRGGRLNNIVLVPELCGLTGLSDDMRNNFHLMRELEEHTRLRPSARMERLKMFQKRLTETPQSKEELSLWNLKFSSDLIDFAGRILRPEIILHGAGEKSEGNLEADWTRSLRGHSLYSSQDFQRWTIIYVRKLQREVDSFVRTLINAASSIKFRIPQPNFKEINDDKPGTYVGTIEMVLSESNPQLIMCIVPNNKADRYDAIKKKCYIDRAVPSQVVLAKNLTAKSVMSIATKIAIQLNCKIGGSPWSVVVPFPKPVMVIGFDVCHDTNIRARSFGAMVASLDGGYSRYYSATSAHTSGEELSNDLCVHVLKAVAIYRSYHKHLPPKIIIYRDGVGEGNEHYVLKIEVDLIRRELQKVYAAETLQMAYIIVSKRINTRLFLNANNPPPGTVADDVITSPVKYDFYLVSQSVKQGTVSPTYYNVVYDTTRLNPDITQQLAYKMTHLYFNWSGTVRVPAPVQYAHKLAFLCGQHLHKPPNEQLSELLYYL